MRVTAKIFIIIHEILNAENNTNNYGKKREKKNHPELFNDEYVLNCVQIIGVFAEEERSKALRSFFSIVTRVSFKLEEDEPMSRVCPTRNSMGIAL